jgi:hypothetical protein
VGKLLKAIIISSQILKTGASHSLNSEMSLLRTQDQSFVVIHNLYTCSLPVTT